MPYKLAHREFRCFVHWLWLMGLVLALLYLSWDSGVLTRMINTDQTYISLLILLLFAAGCAHSGVRSWRLSQTANDVLRWRGAGQWPPPGSLLQTYLQQLEGDAGAREPLLTEWLGEMLRGPQQAGWFTSGALIKLGLLGTVVGFVIMLNSLGSIDSLEPSQVQILMQQMTRGMGIALNTTLLGLCGSLLLGIVYLFLDRSADAILAEVIAAMPDAD